jgi:hypothetical protein
MTDGAAARSHSSAVVVRSRSASVSAVRRSPKRRGLLTPRPRARWSRRATGSPHRGSTSKTAGRSRCCTTGSPPELTWWAVWAKAPRGSGRRSPAPGWCCSYGPPRGAVSRRAAQRWLAGAITGHLLSATSRWHGRRCPTCAGLLRHARDRRGVCGLRCGGRARESFRWWLLAGIATGLGCLMKGPVGRRRAAPRRRTGLVVRAGATRACDGGTWQLPASWPPRSPCPGTPSWWRGTAWPTSTAS